MFFFAVMIEKVLPGGTPTDNTFRTGMDEAAWH